jgi:hypothetical protein
MPPRQAAACRENDDASCRARAWGTDGLRSSPQSGGDSPRVSASVARVLPYYYRQHTGCFSLKPQDVRDTAQATPHREFVAPGYHTPPTQPFNTAHPFWHPFFDCRKTACPAGQKLTNKRAVRQRFREQEAGGGQMGESLAGGIARIAASVASDAVRIARPLCETRKFARSIIRWRRASHRQNRL